MKKNIRLPSVMPLIPLKDTVVFPQSITSLYINQSRSKKAVLAAMETNRMVFLSAVKSGGPNLGGPHHGGAPRGDTLRNEPHRGGRQTVYKTGCIALIRQKKETPDGRIKILTQGMQRAVIQSVEEKSHSSVSVEILKERTEDSEEIRIRLEELKNQLKDLYQTKKFLSFDFLLILNGVKDPGAICDLALSHLKLKPAALQKALETLDVKERLERTKKLLWEEYEMFQLQGQIKNILQTSQPPPAAPDRSPFKADGFHSFKINKKEDVHEYSSKIQKADLPDHVRKEASRQINRLEKMHTESSDASIVRNYLDWILELPWRKCSEDRLNLKEAKIILNKNHFELHKAKERILEFLAVQSLTKNPKGPILCFSGPPGVGKTSLAQSIASAMGRKCFRVSLGGVKDEAEIRGHRKTYVGAMPGKIIQALKTCGTANPVIILDEIDKLCSDFRGDPGSALLEVLDPEQNHSFKDHFLNLNFDLSRTLFIATANLTQNIPPALRDRFEIISISGYTQEEKVQIAQNHLTGAALSGCGLPKNHIQFTKEGLRAIIESYTREAGLRSLKREIASICRKAAKNFVLGKKEPLVITKKKSLELLGAPRFLPETTLKKPQVGIALGLAWTEAGGEILYVQAKKIKYQKEDIKLTGKLGEVMKESAEVAFSFVKSYCEKLNVDPDWFTKNKIHVHLPAGGVPKDGPSAGVVLSLALLSCITGIPVDNNLAATGEADLSGKIRPVGGVKEKALAAFTHGLNTVLIPKENEKDLSSIPENIRKNLNIILVNDLEEVFSRSLVLPKSVSSGDILSEEEPPSGKTREPDAPAAA